MKRSDVETQEDLIDYYEGLIDYLDDNVPCLGELIQMYDEGLEEDE